MASNEAFTEALQAIAKQANAYEQRAKSQVEKRYGDTMRESAAVLARFARSATFEQLIRTEKMFQQNDLLVYARRSAAVTSVREGIDDIKAGEEVYKQLLEDTEAYKAHKYRKKDSVSPDNAIPLDAMRKALRGQARRVGNYRENVMGNPQEQEFLTARIAMLRRAEQLYDAIQRAHLSPSGNDA